MNFPMTYHLVIKRTFYVLFLVLFFGITSGIQARELPKRPEPARLVNDFASILKANEVALLENKLVAFDDSTSNQITIVTLSNLDGEPASSYAPELFNSWKIGHEGRNNGILILVSMDNPREVFINTGYGMEEFVPDITAGRIVQEDLLPYFKKERYYEGLDKASTDLMQLLSGTFKGFAKKKQSKRIPPLVIVIIIIIAVIVISRSKGGGRGGYIRTLGGPTFGGWGGGFGGGGFGGGSSGGGFGGGGFGGFGGGSSGGGGAGGNW